MHGASKGEMRKTAAGPDDDVDVAVRGAVRRADAPSPAARR